ncbi:MAG: transcription antitermination factor NusB [Rhodospirillales bacterium]
MSLALRTSSRLAAVQAHYELDLVGGDAGEVAAAFMSKRWNQAATADSLADITSDTDTLDEAFFADLMEGTVRELAVIDDKIRGALTKPESYERLEPLVRAILRVGTYELVNRIDVPVKVVISEYIELARDFFEGTQVKLINGVLDTLAHDIRAAEFPQT